MEELFLDTPKLYWILASDDTTAASFSPKKIPPLPFRKFPFLMVRIMSGQIAVGAAIPRWCSRMG
jgi:hypothetical protein